MTRTITALFDTVEAANRAARTLAEQVGGVRGTIYDFTQSTKATLSQFLPRTERL